MKENIFLIFDACHVLKLVRKCLGDIRVLKDREVNSTE